MKGKTFLILLVAAGVLVALSFLRFGDRNNPDKVKMGAKLFTDLPVNQVVSVTIADSENKVTLVKGEKVWQVEERNGYPANFDELRDTVVKLSRLKIGRSFSASAESLIRLSLVAPAAPGTPGSGKQIILKDQSGKIIADIILGQSRETEDGESGGQYLKKAEAETVFLVDGNFQFLKTAPAQWLDKEILDIKAENVASVVCYSSNNRTPVYSLTRPAKGEAPLMTPVPEGRVADASKIDQVFDALAPLTIEDVKTVSGLQPTPESDRLHLTYRLYDGRQVFIFPTSDDNDNYTLQITAEASAVEATEPAQEEGKPSEGEAEAPKAPAPEPKTARQLNEELSPWVFSVKKWQFDSLITQYESLLEEVKKEGEGGS